MDAGPQSPRRLDACACGGGLITFVRVLTSGGQESHGRERSPGLDILEERYAKGEVQCDEYLQKKRDLGA